MAIPVSKYVSITSAVGGAGTASARVLMLRLMTNNVLIPTGSVVEFADADAVGVYFGTLSDEYLMAVFYFGFISKLTTTADAISFARWADVDVAPTVFGTAAAYAHTDFTGISDGALTITLGTTEIITGMNFTAVTSLADVAAVLQVDIRAADVAAVYASCTVTYNATDSRFEFLGGATGAFAMDITPGGSGTEIAPLIGWTAPGVRLSDGVVAESVTDLLTASTELSNNFGSFAFVPTQSADEILEAATWTDGENVTYMYCEKVLDVDAATLFASINLLGGTGLTLYDGTLTPVEYPWLFPAALFAATPYRVRASVQNYMFQVPSLSPTVTTAALSATYDAIRVNYMGQTQQAGQNVSFYQRGFLMGGSSDPIDMGVFTNEVALKDAIGVAIFNLLLALASIPASSSGAGQVLLTIQSEIDTALLNGTISVGKTLNSTQRSFITSITGDANLYIQIQDIGYWIDAVIAEPTPNEFEVQYTLLYSKNDSVRKVTGTHTLI